MHQVPLHPVLADLERRYLLLRAEVDDGALSAENAATLLADNVAQDAEGSFWWVDFANSGTGAVFTRECLDGSSGHTDPSLYVPADGVVAMDASNVVTHLEIRDDDRPAHSEPSPSPLSGVESGVDSRTAPVAGAADETPPPSSGSGSHYSFEEQPTRYLVEPEERSSKRHLVVIGVICVVLSALFWLTAPRPDTVGVVPDETVVTTDAPAGEGVTTSTLVISMPSD